MTRKSWMRPRFPSEVVAWKLRTFAALLALTCAVYAAAIYAATGREQFPAQYAQVDPGIRDWFRSQQVPGGASKGMSCCSDADGVQAEEDWAGDHYRARFTIRNSVTGEEYDIPWTDAPPNAVLTGPFPARVGQPVVWWFAQWDNSRAGVIKRNEFGNLMIYIRCFKPGSGV